MNGTILKAVTEYGFAGLSAVLVGMLVWMIKQMFKLLRDTTGVIAANTRAIEVSSLAAIAAADALRASITSIDMKGQHLLTVIEDVRTRILESRCPFESRQTLPKGDK